MKRFFTATYALIIMLSSNISFADEGLWIPSELKGNSIFDSLSTKGCKIPETAIYSDQQSSLCMQVVRLSTGCTGSFISDSGLVITNRHCLNKIANTFPHSEKICDKGFISHNKKQEILLPDLSISRTHAIINYTDSIVPLLSGIESYQRKQKIADSLCIEYENKWADSTGFYAIIKPGLHYNTFHLYLTEKFKDVRLVLLPPQDLNFGKTIDNWQWPRHSADFALLRIYADSTEIPLHTPYHLKLSDSAAARDDFTMVLGYPSSTSTLLTATGLQLFTDSVLPHRIASLKARENAILNNSKHSDVTKHLYSAKLFQTINTRQKYNGVQEMLPRYNGIAIKRQDEQLFRQSNSSYDTILEALENNQNHLVQYEKQETLLLNLLTSSDLLLLSIKLRKLQIPGVQLDKAKTQLIEKAERVNNTINTTVETEIIASLLCYYIQNSARKWIPNTLENLSCNEIPLFAKKAVANSCLTNTEKLSKYIKDYNPSQSNKLDKDPLFSLALELYNIYTFSIKDKFQYHSEQIDSLYHDLLKIKLSSSEHPIYDNANATLRLSYGKITPVSPSDGINNSWFTTSRGIIEKHRKAPNDYPIPEEYFSYLKNNIPGNLHTCFISDCHTSGGNSGSPVLNGNGQIIGINFDRTWQSTMSDYYYSDKICRNISVDIAFINHLLKHYFNAESIVDEIHRKK